MKYYINEHLGHISNQDGQTNYYVRGLFYLYNVIQISNSYTQKCNSNIPFFLL